MSSRAGLAIILVLAAAVVVGTMLSGCAAEPKKKVELPPCERFTFMAIEKNGEPNGIFLDMRGVYQLNEMITGLATLRCRLPRQGEGLS